MFACPIPERRCKTKKKAVVSAGDGVTAQSKALRIISSRQGSAKLLIDVPDHLIPLGRPSLGPLDQTKLVAWVPASLEDHAEAQAHRPRGRITEPVAPHVISHGDAIPAGVCLLTQSTAT